jgi:uncharacterized protein (UPF0248 family)
MPQLHDLLNEIKWTKDLRKIEIWYLHHGAPHDTKIITGPEIVSLGKSFLETTTATIPYHRIIKIIYEGETVFDRRNLKKSENTDKQL